MVVGLTVLLGLTACQHPPPPPRAPSPALSMSGGGDLSLKIRGPELELRPPLSPDIHLDLNWLDLDEFVPPGAKKVGPTVPLAVELNPIERTRFPTVEPCTSPDKKYTLFHDGLKQKNRRTIHHWLMFLRDEPRAYPNMIFGTDLSFEASWAGDSRHFAVTHFVGDNSSETFAVDVDDLVRRTIRVQPFIEEYFPERLWNEKMFVKAYRWTRDGRLVVRAIARAHAEPYELFGCEVLVTFAGPDTEPKLTYLRGYIKPQAGKD